jgi:hypothetical protein
MLILISSVTPLITESEQVVTHQPAISFSISLQFPFNRAGGRTSNVLQRNEEYPPPAHGVTALLVRVRARQSKCGVGDGAWERY